MCKVKVLTKPQTKIQHNVQQTDENQQSETIVWANTIGTKLVWGLTKLCCFQTQWDYNSIRYYA